MCERHIERERIELISESPGCVRGEVDEEMRLSMVMMMMVMMMPMLTMVMRRSGWRM